MRDKILNNLNALLEIDHDAVVALMTAEFHLAIDSDLNDHPITFEKQGIKMATALNIINHCIGGDPIMPVFENGVIQVFK